MVPPEYTRPAPHPGADAIKVAIGAMLLPKAQQIVGRI
jgi:hypothetical protein